MERRTGHTRLLVVIGVVFLLLAAGGIAAWAESSGLITACRATDGSLRVVTDSSQCQQPETSVAWSGSAPAGLACWDLNRDNVGDPGEDVNGDGQWDAADCRGPQGQAGPQGAAGQPGAPGMSCWDLNGNNVRDPEEDANQDKKWDAKDCQGLKGETGRACWDLNSNGTGDPREDLNQERCLGQRRLPGRNGPCLLGPRR